MRETLSRVWCHCQQCCEVEQTAIHRYHSWISSDNRCGIVSGKWSSWPWDQTVRFCPGKLQRYEIISLRFWAVILDIWKNFWIEAPDNVAYKGLYMAFESIKCLKPPIFFQMPEIESILKLCQQNKSKYQKWGSGKVEIFTVYFKEIVINCLETV